MPTNPDAPRPGPTAARRMSSAWWGTSVLLVVLATGFLFSWHSLSDLDIWFHLRAGRDLLAGHGVTSTNLYSFTEPDRPWVNHEWMFQALTALTGPAVAISPATDGVPDVLGWNLMRSFLTFLLLLTLLGGDGGWDRFRGRDGPAAAAWSGVPVLMGLLLIWPRLTIRPELFSYLFFVVLIRGVEHFLRGPGSLASTEGKSPANPTDRWVPYLDPRQPGGLIVLLTVIWAQFHGFASLAPLVLLLGWMLTPFQVRLTPPETTGGRLQRRRGIILVGLTLIALTLTPNGWNGLLMPVRALGQFSQNQVDLRATVSELVPLQDSPNSLALTIAVYRVGMVWGLIWIVGTFGKVSLLRIFIFALAAVAAWSNQRSIGFFGLAFILLHTGAGSHPWRFATPGRLTTIRPTAMAAAGLAITLLAAGFLWPRIVSDEFYLKEGVGRRFGSGVTPAHFQIQAAADLASQQDPKVFANLDAAAFLLANTSARPFIDGRTEAYSAELWSEYHVIKRGDGRSLQHLAQRGVASVCLATGSGAFDLLAEQLLASPAWKLWTAEGAGLLFRPGDDVPGSAILEQAARNTMGSAGGQSSARNADFCLAAGRLYKFAGNDALVEDSYRRGLDFRSNHPTLNHNLGNLLLNRNNFREALPHFQAALAVNSRLIGSALNAGVCQMRLGRPAEAAQSFRRAVAMDSGRFEGWVNLSAAYHGSGNRQGAISALKKALEIRPGDPRLQQRLRELNRGARN